MGSRGPIRYVRMRMRMFAKRAARRAKLREREQRAGFVESASRITPHVAVENDGTLFFLPTRQKAGVDRFLKPEWKEHRHLQRALDVLENVGVEVPRTTFVDVGAHIGTTTIAAVRRFGFESALAFEPELANFRLLRANLGVNGLERQILTFNVAVSNRVGNAELALRPTIGTKHSLLREGEDATNTVRVPLTTLDTLIEDGSLDPAQVSLLWLDVEGHELEVLQGARRLLERSVPIVMEFTPRKLRREGRLEALRSVLGEQYTRVLDLRIGPHEDPGIGTLDALGELARRYRHGVTDLLVFRHSGVVPSRALGDRPERQADGQLRLVEHA